MADLATQTLRVLRFALELEAFTMPQLVSCSGVSYETVKRVLRAEEGRLVGRTGDKASRGVGRPADVWTVIAVAAIEARLEAAQEVLSAAEKQAAVAEPATAGDSYLAHAEDQLAFALRAGDPDDAAAFAAKAIGALEDANIEPAPMEPALGSLRAIRNVPKRQARASIIDAMSKYILSNEAKGLDGPMWRRAFRALATAELPHQVALHRRFMVDLVRLADERLSAHQTATLPQADLVDMLMRAVSRDESSETLISSLREESQLSREAVRAALARLVSEVAKGIRVLEPAVTMNLLSIVQAAFPRGSEMSDEALEELVQGLCWLSVDTGARTAARARETLLAIHQPQKPSFWRRLADDAGPTSYGTVFAALSHVSFEDAFAYTRELLDRQAPLSEVRDMLQLGLPELDRSDRGAAQEHFAEFLASVSQEARDQLVAVPTLAELDWPIPRFERPLVRQLFVMLTRWLALVRGDHPDGRVVVQRETLGREIERLALEIFDLLDYDERRRLIYLLTMEIYAPAAAAVFVPVLLDLGLEAELARSVMESTTEDDEAWAAVGEWYLAVCPRKKLTPKQLEVLLNALRAALDQHASSFLLGLSRARPQLHELTENPAIDTMVRVGLELDSYGAVAGQLAAAAAGHAEVA